MPQIGRNPKEGGGHYLRIIGRSSDCKSHAKVLRYLATDGEQYISPTFMLPISIKIRLREQQQLTKKWAQGEEVEWSKVDYENLDKRRLHIYKNRSVYFQDYSYKKKLININDI